MSGPTHAAYATSSRPIPNQSVGTKSDPYPVWWAYGKSPWLISIEWMVDDFGVARHIPANVGKSGPRLGRSMMDGEGGMAEEILYSAACGVATITFNRPEKLNSWTPSMEQQLRALTARAASDRSVRAIVLTGAGRAFCAGADLSGPRGKRQPPSPDAARGDLEQRYSYLLGIPKPIIAAINGPAAGVGLAIALYCDLRYVAAGAKINTAFVRRGLIAEHGTSWLLPRLVGTMNALELLLTGTAISAEHADRIGLARLLPAERFADEVGDIARDLAAWSSPRAMSVIKRQVYADWSRPLGEAVAIADMEQFACLESDDLREGIASFLEKRTPNFEGLGDA